MPVPAKEGGQEDRSRLPKVAPEIGSTKTERGSAFERSLSVVAIPVTYYLLHLLHLLLVRCPA